MFEFQSVLFDWGIEHQRDFSLQLHVGWDNDWVEWRKKGFLQLPLIKMKRPKLDLLYTFTFKMY